MSTMHDNGRRFIDDRCRSASPAVYDQNRMSVHKGSPPPACRVIPSPAMQRKMYKKELKLHHSSMDNLNKMNKKQSPTTNNGASHHLSIDPNYVKKCASSSEIDKIAQQKQTCNGHVNNHQKNGGKHSGSHDCLDNQNVKSDTQKDEEKKEPFYNIIGIPFSKNVKVPTDSKLKNILGIFKETSV